MDLSSILLALLIGMVVGAVASMWWNRDRERRGQEEMRRTFEQERADLEQRSNAFRASAEERTNEVLRLGQALATEQERGRGLVQRLEEQKVELEQLQARMTVEFENIANRLLSQRGKELNEQQQVKLDLILKPLQERIKDFEEEFQALVDALVPLGMREYSIASIASDGVLELIVRQERHPDGSLGLGSGWLTEHAALGSAISLRLRRNSGFHLPDAPVPLILLGNGTGLAGLRSLLKARIADGQQRNWLLFGERNIAHDYLCQDELQGWLASGDLALLDLAFSRDQEEKIYVQDRLRESADVLRKWLADGAAIYVCGSLQGMATGVDQALADILGNEALERLIEQGRYRRDVY